MAEIWRQEPKHRWQTNSAYRLAPVSGIHTESKIFLMEFHVNHRKNTWVQSQDMGQFHISTATLARGHCGYGLKFPRKGSLDYDTGLASVADRCGDRSLESRMKEQKTEMPRIGSVFGNRYGVEDTIHPTKAALSFPGKDVP